MWGGGSAGAARSDLLAAVVVVVVCDVQFEAEPAPPQEHSHEGWRERIKISCGKGHVRAHLFVQPLYSNGSSQQANQPGGG